MLVTADNLVQMFFGWEGRRPRLLSADRLLVPQADAPTRRRSRRSSSTASAISASRSASSATFLVFGTVSIPAILAAAPGMAGSTIGFLGHARRHDDVALPPAVHRRDGQIGAARPAHLAARRDGGPDAGLRADPRRDDGHRRRVHGLPPVADVRDAARPRSPSSPSSAPRPPCSPRRSARCRTTSSG